MSSAIAERVSPGQPEDGLAGLALGLNRAETAGSEQVGCFHCGEPCPDRGYAKAEKVFCCQGCLVVHELLAENGLGQFYELSRHPGVRIRRQAKQEQWDYLDEPVLQQRLLDFTDGKLSRVTFKIPAIHCVACVWLLENLFRLHPGVGTSQVNFPRREVALSFAPQQIPLSELVALLASIGYEPQLTLDALEKPKPDVGGKRRWLQVGLAGFAFGNIMLLSIPRYLGLDSFSGPMFKVLFGYLSLALAAPVVIYSAADYWRSAALALSQRVLTLEVPIAVGLAALYAQSAFDIVTGRGEGYLDSLAGLVFFLLCGRVFQQKTHDRMAFDRDYKCFFPLSVKRKTEAGEENVALSDLRVGDRLCLRNGELIPADGRLVNGTAVIDYSFVTGESEPVSKQPGDYLYAGGQQTGGLIEVEMLKAVSQSYLTSLWNHEAFAKQREADLNTLTNRYSRRFTRLVIGVALVAALCWLFSGQAGRGLKAFTSVLIVACPCALALSAPFALGAAQRWLARTGVFLKNGLVLERLAQIDAIVFDKTGTLTQASGERVRFAPAAGDLRDEERGWAWALARQSRHPYSASIAQWLGQAEVGRAVRGTESLLSPSGYLFSVGARPSPGAATTAWSTASEVGSPTVPVHVSAPGDGRAPLNRHRGGEGEATDVPGAPGPRRAGDERLVSSSPTVEGFVEKAGCGIEGMVQEHQVRLGSKAWLERCGVEVPDSTGDEPSPPREGSVVYLAIDGECRGAFALGSALRRDTGELLERLGQQYELALLSGDNERERERFQHLFGEDARLRFNQSPLEKLAFIRGLQDAGKRVMMVGDGLNDAGALKQSDVGVAVVEKVGAFSPASDVILAAEAVPQLGQLLDLARRTTRIVRLGFGISALYNAVGISFAAAGLLSPVLCAVLMPLSSVSVVLFACGAVSWAAKKGEA